MRIAKYSPFKAHCETRTAQAGFSLLFMIGVILAISTFAAGILSMTTSSVYTEINALSFAQARYVALAGFNYVQQFKEDYDELEGATVSLGNGSEFSVGDMRQRQDGDGNLWMDVEITGTVHKGGSHEANYVLDRSFQPEDQGAITFADNWEDFKPITPTGKNPITKNANKTFTIGNNEYYAFGAFYYMGTKTMNWGANLCVFGECQFKYGFRLFFVSHYEKSDADGIVFTWFNSQLDNTGSKTSNHGKDCADYDTGCSGFAAANNKIYTSVYEACEDDDATTACGLYASVGGDSEWGELIGYAGDGRYTDRDTGKFMGWLDPERNGIQAPKMGIEFDNYWNGSSSICGSSSLSSGPNGSSRRDPENYSSSSTDKPALGYVFWGNSDTYYCALYSSCAKWSGWTCKKWNYYTKACPSSWYSCGTSNSDGAKTYDDNRHGLGLNAKPLDLYEKSITWAYQTFAFRAEVERHYRKNEDGKYTYIITSWLTKSCDKKTDDCAEYWDDSYYDEHPTKNSDNLYLSDTSRFLCWDSEDTKCSHLNPPTLKLPVALTEEQNEMFDTMMFGFTEATGGSTQKATYSQFILQFIKKNDYNDDGTRRRVHDRKIDNILAE